MSLSVESQIRLAWDNFTAGKRPSAALDEFRYYLESNLKSLNNDITNKSYAHGKYKKITVIEKKRRDLSVASVRDRVVHRLVYDELVHMFDKIFDYDVWSCRKGKGLHKCIRRTQEILCKNRYSYVWRSDIKRFFDSVDHERLLLSLERKIQKGSTLYFLCTEIINSYTTDRQTDRQTDRHPHWQRFKPDLF